jgi:hypothetical protein
MKHTWQVAVAAGSLEVSGFPDAKRARDHATKHFFNPLERWYMLCDAPPTPEDYEAQFRTADADSVARELLEQTARRYVGITEQQTATPYRTAIYQHHPHFEGRYYAAYESFSVVTHAGVFAAFAKAQVSELRTAFRPELVLSRAPLTNRDYRDAASRKLNFKVSQARLGGRT